MKKLLFFLFCLATLLGRAQVYNNEWIDFNKTYYKLKVGRTGLHRVSKADLAAAGLGSVPVEHLQLWRNGAEVRLFTPVASGELPANQSIEFWGERNDGKPDLPLYRKPENQLNDRFSLHTDTSVYFLTVNTAGNNRRWVSTPNNVAGNTLPPVPYFLHTHNQSFSNQINGGFALDVDQYLYSSAYDLGEGYSSPFIGTNGSNTVNLGNLFVAPGGPQAMFRITVMGNRIAQRRFRVRINTDSIMGRAVDFFNAVTDSAVVPLSVISGTINNVQVTNVSTTRSDRLAIYKYELTYPRLFNFGNSTNFEFDLPAANAPRYLEISNFNRGNTIPVLLDQNNGIRILGDVSVPGQIRFVLPPLAQPGKMVLYSQATNNLVAVRGLESRRFVDYRAAANQADYLIISNRLLFGNSPATNAVETYAQYRRSAAGGRYDARVYDVEELVDQFAFGIKKSPLAIRNFLRFARASFATQPKHVLLMGKGMVYTDQRARERDANSLRLNLVPTFGNPASDILFVTEPGRTVPLISIGRLSVVSGQEILDYLAKVKEYEAAQASGSGDPTDKRWQKNVAHIIGSGDPNLQQSLEQYMSSAKNILADTSWGADVHTFTKKTGANVEQISDQALEQLFAEGMSLINYFGHSSTSGLDYNLENPDAYQNKGKYPFFSALGCNAGNFFGFNTNRFSIKDAISEKYVLAPQKGTIGFIASSHFGIVSILRIWNTQFYEQLARLQYGRPMGEVLNATAARVLAQVSGNEENFMVRANLEQTILHGDPALRLNLQDKPDFAITDPQVKVEPAFVSVADTAFRVKVNLMNLGKAIRQPIVLEVRRRFPNQTEILVARDTIAAPFLAEEYTFSIPVNASRDKGTNRIIVMVDADNAVSELFETNNSVNRDVIVYEDEARPVAPYNFAIVNQPDLRLAFSTADPLRGVKAYDVELDTTELFNSPGKWQQRVSSAGGLVELRPAAVLRGNTVYYWRVSLVPDSGPQRWNTSSFLYLPNGSEGFNQGHVYQHLKSGGTGLAIDSADRTWRFGKVPQNLFARNAMFPTGGNQDIDFSVAVNGAAIIQSACVGRSLVLNVFDARTFKPWINVDARNRNLFLYGSGSANCRPNRQFNFEFSYLTPASRRLIMNFMDTIPVGSFVAIRSHDANNPNSFTRTWMADTLLFGKDNSLYHKLKAAGFAAIDSIDRPRSWLLIYQKGNPASAQFAFTQGVTDKITLSADFTTDASEGQLLSPVVGPARSWQEFVWEGTFDGSNEMAQASIIGVTTGGRTDTLVRNIRAATRSTSLSGVDARTYPYLRMALRSTDSIRYTPYQLNFWRLAYTPVPEGAIAPNLRFQLPDTVTVGDELPVVVAFKNISTQPFDSLRVKLLVTDRNNNIQAQPLGRLAPLRSGDTVTLRTSLNTRSLSGAASLFLEFNPDEDQPEQFQFNNFLFRNIYVQDDEAPPVMDVTFDNVRILNNDIISAKPDILIKLTDESSRLLLNDTALVTVRVRNLTTDVSRTYHFDNDTLRFVPASSTTQNVATVNFKPYFAEDGTYELQVTGKDRRGNRAGPSDYRVRFQIINKPMISNMLNYPNPFTTATAFVFTLTGSEVPQNMKIQIMTVTGKIVREITRQELGPLRIGRNITEFKWDGTDQFGQKLANGVYLYRVVAQQEGRSLDKYHAADDDTDKYFNKGYGKMYLMR